MKPTNRSKRMQAIDFGVLVDVSTVAKEAGIKFPTAITSAAWNKYVEVPEGVAGQVIKGRLWDVLYMMPVAAKKAESAEILYKLYVALPDRGD